MLLFRNRSLIYIYKEDIVKSVFAELAYNNSLDTMPILKPYNV